MRRPRSAFGRAVIAGTVVAALGIAAVAVGQPLALDLMSSGPAGGNGPADVTFLSASEDGSSVLFQTAERLTSGDTDSTIDLYVRSGDQTTLISTGATGGNDAADVEFWSASDDLTRVLFGTAEPLTAQDADLVADVYEHFAGQTTLLSLGPAGGNDPIPTTYASNTDDGAVAFFETDESLIASDTDSSTDVYARAGAALTHVSAGGTAELDASFSKTSEDGSRWYFNTTEALLPSDADATSDMYERSGGQLALMPAFVVHALGDGTRLFLLSNEQLAPEDDDATQDIYELFNGVMTLVSTGPTASGEHVAFYWTALVGGTRVFFETTDALVAADGDTKMDLYERSGGVTRLVTPGEADVDARVRSLSDDGEHIFFDTEESLSPADTDTRFDGYLLAGGGAPTLVTTGPAGGNGEFDASVTPFRNVGPRGLFITNEPLVSEDTDQSRDVYEWFDGTTTLLSIGTSGGNAEIDANWTSTTDDGLRVFFRTTEALTAGDVDSSLDIYRSTMPGPPEPEPTATPTPTPDPIATPTPTPTPEPEVKRCATTRSGGGKADLLTGTALGDRLRGRGGNDRLNGLGGDDCLSGGRGNDRLSGGPGADRLDGGRGRDRLAGGSGNDRIDARDRRRDRVRCGSGRDRVTADRKDRVAGCETVRRP